MGLGAIIATVEIPVSVLMANILLKEPVSFLQWVGVILILFAVVLMNIGKKEKKEGLVVVNAKEQTELSFVDL
jgi:drug/metabolite transporter (DMT)-like permease